jgi:hypothetical protein
MGKVCPARKLKIVLSSNTDLMVTKKAALSVPPSPLPVAVVERRIYLIRGQKGMLDADLAARYEVPTKRLNEQVRRNLQRFPDDFMFQLTIEEAAALRSQIVTSKEGRGGRRYLPYVFTEQGVAMLSSVLNSERAIEVNIVIMRAFVRLREMMLSNDELNRKINALERKYDGNFQTVFAALRALLAAPKRPRRQIGFKTAKQP